MPLVPPYVAALSAAAPARAGEGPARDAAPVAWLDANENALGPSPRAVEAAREAAARAHRYPDASAAALRAALAAKLGVEPREVLVGNGSSELVELLVRTFVLDGEDVLTSAQTWPAYRLAAQVHGRKLVEAPMKARHGVDLEAIKKLLSRRTKLVFLANPDSPTGTCLLEAELTPFLDAVPKDTLVVLDEAYVEFADAPGFPDALALRRRYPNLVVLRTFSKVHGLAGLRVGYGVARPDVADYIERVRPPHDVNAIAQAAGVAATSRTPIARIPMMRRMDPSRGQRITNSQSRRPRRVPHPWASSDHIGFKSRRQRSSMGRSSARIPSLVTPSGGGDSCASRL